MTARRQLPQWAVERPLRQQLLADRLCDPLPDTPLYHYTDQKGLLSILTKKEIWASHTQYLNDREEYHHALKKLRDRLDQAFEAAPDTETAILIDALMGKAPKLEANTVCVASFSPITDSLPQWRAYGGNHSSFAIGFSPEGLNRVAKENDGLLVRCVYENSEHDSLVEALVQECVSRADENRREEMKLWVTDALSVVHRYAPIVKHEAFYGEVEWRLISPHGKSVKLKFREGRSTLVPYVALPFLLSDIEEVVVGPTIHAKEARRAVQGFLSSIGLPNLKVTDTTVPYRAW